MDKIGQLMRNWILPDKSIIGFCLFLLLVVWYGVYWQAGRDYRTTIETVQAENNKFALAFEEHVRRVLRTNEQYLVLLKNEYESHGATPALRDILTQIAFDPLITQASLLNQQGRPVVIARPVDPQASFADLPHFASHTGADMGRLYIAKPALGRVSKQFTIQLSRRVNNADGSFGGICTIAISPFYFSQFYNAMDFNENYVVRVTGLDGIVRASNDEKEINADISGAGLWKQMAERSSGFYYSTGSVFGKPRLMSFRVMPDYPLVVQVGVSESTLAPMHQRRTLYFASAGVMSVFVLFYLFAGIGAARRRRQSERELQASYEQLTAAHEELTATEEELRSQYESLEKMTGELAERENQLRSLFEHMHDAFALHEIICDEAGRPVDFRYLFTNSAFDALLDKPKGEIIGRTVRELLPTAEPFWIERYGQVALTGRPANITEYVAALDKYYAVSAYSPEPNMFAVLVIDITEEKNAESRLRQKEEQLEKSYRELSAAHEKLTVNEEELRTNYEALAKEQQRKTAMYSLLPDLVILADRNGKVLDYNEPPVFPPVLTKEALLGNTVFEFLPPEAAERELACTREVLRTGRPDTHELSLEVDGKCYFHEVRIVKVNDSQVMVLVRDITEQKNVSRNLEYLTLHDALTGAFNRAHFETDRIRIEEGGYKSVGMFIFDVDGLKVINDTLGHHWGDELLKNVAELLVAEVEEPDYVARIGGDEFAIVMFDPTNETMEELERRLRKKVAAYNDGTPQLPLSLSIGWAIEEGKPNVDKVLKAADNNMYRQKMHQSQSIRGSIVRTMMKALEAKDHITEGHVDRMDNLMVRMGRKRGFTQGQIADLRLFAKFHDIGKVGIPDAILMKPGRLSEEEMIIMRRHSEIGFRIAKSSPDLAPIADWILKHHEYWDGRGYPLGLSGEHVPVQCRILGIVDAFDAMTSDRPYRKAMTSEAAFAELRRCSGAQFDPCLVEDFMAVARECL